MGKGTQSTIIAPAKEVKVCAKWRADCGHKKDYDGRIISLSTRYWDYPSPSAASSINLNHGEPDDYGYGDSIQLVRQEFEGETETGVKQQVEKWSQEEFNKIYEALRNIYPKPKCPCGNEELDKKPSFCPDCGLKLNWDIK